MCGIAGLVERAQPEDTQLTLKAMAAAIAHRGPDDEGFLVASTRDGDHVVGLAHRGSPLSIYRPDIDASRRRDPDPLRAGGSCSSL